MKRGKIALFLSWIVVCHMTVIEYFVAHGALVCHVMIKFLTASTSLFKMLLIVMEKKSRIINSTWKRTTWSTQVQLCIVSDPSKSLLSSSLNIFIIMQFCVSPHYLHCDGSKLSVYVCRMEINSFKLTTSITVQSYFRLANSGFIIMSKPLDVLSCTSKFDVDLDIVSRTRKSMNANEYIEFTVYSTGLHTASYVRSKKSLFWMHSMIKGAYYTVH